MVSATATAGTQLMGLSLGFRVSPREPSFLRPALTPKALAAGEVPQQWSREQDISALPGLNGQGQHWELCPKLAPWPKELHPSSSSLTALPALPSHCPGSRCPPAPAGTSQLSWEALGCAGTEQAVGRGARAENVWDVAVSIQLCSVRCHAESLGMALSPQEPGADFTDQISLEIFKTLISRQPLPWTPIWPSWILGLTLRQGLGQPPSDQTQHRSGAELGWAGSVCANSVGSSPFLFLCSFLSPHLLC